MVTSWSVEVNEDVAQLVHDEPTRQAARQIAAETQIGPPIAVRHRL